MQLNGAQTKQSLASAAIEPRTPAPAAGQRRFLVILIKPSHYDADG
jgi:hypothetical protein